MEGMPIKRIGKSHQRTLKHAGPYVFFLAALLAFSWGCASKKALVRANYNDSLNKWTVSKKVYDGLEARLFIGATYETPSFRKAYVERYVEDYELEDSYKKQLLEREKEQEEKYNEFFIAAYTPVEGWNDLDKRDSVWKLYLVDSAGSRVIPISVTRVDSSDPRVREFFPYLDLWSFGYDIKFPKFSETGAEMPSKDAKYLKLIVTGVLGTGELEWRLK